MRRLLLSLVALLGFATAQAQLPAGSLAPDFTLKDINGTVHNLYTYLNQGKTVFIDVSAAWCAPCWNYHNQHHLRALYENHGPTGWPSVNANTTNDVVVLYVEGETTNTTAQLYGPAASTGSYATTTQGNWVTGTPYPIIDTPGATQSAWNTAWNIGYFPTIYMICQDRLVYEVGQLDSNALYAAVAAGCPSYGPSATVDAKAINSTNSPFYCSNAVGGAVRFQNYSATQTITSATIKTYSGSTLVNTSNWTGSLAPYGIATATVTPYSVTNPAIQSDFTYVVQVTGDSKIANDSAVKTKQLVYGTNNASATPYLQDFEGVNTSTDQFPLGWVGKDNASNGFFFTTAGTSSTSIIGANGAATKAMICDFFNNQSGTFVLSAGNYNLGAGPLHARFDVAYAQYDGTENDRLELVVSEDCGATWTSLWSKSGAALSTHAPVGGTSIFLPSSSADWRVDGADVSAYANKSNVLFGFRATSAYGNYGFIDNFRINNATAIDNILNEASVSVSPNPANENLKLDVNTSVNGKYEITLVDYTGKVVFTKNVTGSKISETINVSNISSGIYNLVIKSENGLLNKKVSITH